MDKSYSQTLCKVNDSVVRMAVIQGDLVGTNTRTLTNSFSFLDGHFLIDVEDRVVDLAPKARIGCTQGCPPSHARTP